MHGFNQLAPFVHLQHPIAIPATSASLGSPFLRAYPIELEAYDLPSSVFLSFIDELNRLMVASPPVQVLGLAGDVVGLVPEPTAQIVGTVISAAAQATTYGMSKGLSEKFIRESNDKMFAPRGLKANIVKLEVVAKVANIPILDCEGNVAKDSKLLAPVENFDLHLSGQQRRLMALAPYTSPLEVVPSEQQVKPDGMWHKMNAYASEKQRASEEKKALEHREKAYDAQPKHEEKLRKETAKIRNEFDKGTGKLSAEAEKVKKKSAKKPEKMENELFKISREQEKLQRKHAEEMAKAQGKSIKKDKEEAAVRKILWLLIQKQDAAMPQY
jgi:hypothetical protein